MGLTLMRDASLEATTVRVQCNRRKHSARNQRFLNWHPIVLEEQAMKDFAPQDDNTCYDYFGTSGMTELDAGLVQQIRYVPLPPTETGYRRDNAHAKLKSPKFLSATPSHNFTEMYLG
ncbi:hypothetical protein [Rubinisphaera margarita]|uniref:hypothetical protein n=1 Tax=Rubinisphaera margarita TaxID=2909586 RepID=UPI001EE816D5|nr:hypothetical protein [Rubinisphaera margarita]MCG6154976.1 hypothetical protein [Rubinisphaera margarita]